MRRAGAAVTLAATLLLVLLAGVAQADNATLSITDATGKADAASDLPRVVTVSGNVASPLRVYVAYRAVGGAPCAPTFGSDSGTSIFSSRDANGNFSFARTMTFPDAGTFMVCIWLAPSSTTVSTPITQTITLRPPTGTITATFSPAIPRPGEKFTVTVTGVTEAPKSVYAAIQPAATTCAPTYSSSTGNGLINGADANGAFSLQASTSLEKAGQYLVCLWLAGSSSDTAPVAGPQPQPISVVAPPPPCIVPSLPASRLLAVVQRRLTRAHCSLGRITSKRSALVRRGRVIRLAPAPGTRRANGAAVNVVVSSGRPRR